MRLQDRTLHARSWWGLAATVLLLLLGSLVWGAEPAQAQGANLCVGSGPNKVPNGVLEAGEECDDGNMINEDGCNNFCGLGTCVDDLSGVTNNCTANDVNLGLLTVIEEMDGCAFVGDTATVKLQARLRATSAERYDIGLFIALDGGAARKGACYHDFLPRPLRPAAGGSCAPRVCSVTTTMTCKKTADCPLGETCVNGYNPGSPGLGNGIGPFFNAECSVDAGDVCGDLEQQVDTYFDLGFRAAAFPGGASDPVELTVQCIDTDNDGFTDVGTCVSWDNAKSDGSSSKPSCTSKEQALPNTKAKCRCETLNIINLPVQRSIEVVKDLIPATDPGLFDLQIDGTTVGNASCVDAEDPFVCCTGAGTGTCTGDDVGDGGTTGENDVLAGNHSVGEVAGTSTDLSDYTTDISCEDQVGRCTGDSTVHCLVDAACSAVGAGTCDLTPTPVGSCTDCTSLNLTVPDKLTDIVCTITNTLATTPSLAIDKPAPSNADNDGSGDVSVGDVLTYTITATNDGTANLTNVVVTDSLITPTGGTTPCALVAPSGTCTLIGTYVVTQTDVDAGNIHNVATADSVQTDPVEDPEDVPVPQFPSIEIVKDFAGDDPESIVAGGPGSSFTLVVTNTGNVTLSSVVVTDVVDARLTVTGVAVTTATTAGGETCAGPSQSVSCTIPTLAVNESATITVNFFVAASVPAADDVQNTAYAVGTPPVSVGGTVDDNDLDTIDILVDINLSIIKEFDPDVIEVPQGTQQEFTITVTNAGPSDAFGVVVTDTVNGFLDISDPGAVAVTSGSGSCSWDMTAPPPLAESDITCTVDIPATTSVVITVTYTVAPFLDGAPDYGTEAGSEFLFVFDNGSILEGSAKDGPVYLDGVELDLSGQTLTKNDFLFDPPGPDPPFLLHLSCSDPFTDGWGQSGGPVEGTDVNWQIDYFSIARYKPDSSFHRNCGNVVGMFDVPNTATAAGVDSSPEPDIVSDTDEVTIKEGVRLDKFQKKAKHGSVDLTNFTGDPRLLEYVTVTWPSANGVVRQINLGGVVIWEGTSDYFEDSGKRTVTIGNFPIDDCPPAGSTCDPTAWSGTESDRTLAPDITEKLTFHFTEKAAGGFYDVAAGFSEGTLLNFRIFESGKGDDGGGKPKSQDDSPPPDESQSADEPQESALPSEPPVEAPSPEIQPAEPAAPVVEEPPAVDAEEPPAVDAEEPAPVDAEEPVPADAEDPAAVDAEEPVDPAPVEEVVELVEPPVEEELIETEPLEAAPEVGDEPTLVAELEPMAPARPPTPLAIFGGDAADRPVEGETRADPAADFEPEDPSDVTSETYATFAVDSLTFQLEAERRRLTGSLEMSQIGGTTVDVIETSPVYAISLRPEGGEWTVLEASCVSDRVLVLVVGEQGVARGTVNFACDLEAPVPDPAELRLVTQVVADDGTELIEASGSGEL